MIKNEFIRLCIVAIVGIFIGAYFYPEKTVIKEVEVESESQRQVILKLQSDLKRIESEKKKIETVIIQKPSGEVVTTIVENSERLTQLEQSYKKDIDEKDKEIQRLKDSFKEETNKRRTVFEVGYMFDKSVYGHVTRDLFGPLVIGGHVQFGNNNNFGAGIGFKF